MHIALRVSYTVPLLGLYHVLTGISDTFLKGSESANISMGFFVTEQGWVLVTSKSCELGIKDASSA